MCAMMHNFKNLENLCLAQHIQIQKPQEACYKKRWFSHNQVYVKLYYFIVLTVK